MSGEQTAVVQAVQQGSHAIVTAVPGAGKTELSKFLASSIKGDTLVLTYNRALADSTSDRLDALGNEEQKSRCFTYHGLLSSLSGLTVHSDTLFETIMASPDDYIDDPRDWFLANAKLLVLDESQDLRPSYWYLVMWLITHVLNDLDALQIVALGDPRQLLYGFYTRNAADTRFLSMMDILLGNVNGRPWAKLSLTQSYRVSQPAANVVNVLTQSKPTHRIVSARTISDPKPVKLIVCDVFSDVQREFNDIVRGYSASDIFVTCSSINRRSPVVGLVEHLLSTLGNVCTTSPTPEQRCGLSMSLHCSGDAVSTGSVSSKGQSRQKATKGECKDETPAKDPCMYIRTYNSTKGLEAPLVIVINNGSLFQDITNALYVALTRSKYQLVIFQDRRYVMQSDLAKFANQLTDRDVDITVRRPPATRRKKPRADNDVPSRIKTDVLFSYLATESLSELLSLVDVRAILVESDDDEDLYAPTTEQPDTEIEHNVDFSVASTLPESTVVIDGAGLVHSATMLAAEFYFRQTIPAAITKALVRLSTKPDNRIRSPDGKTRLQCIQQGIRVLRSSVEMIEWSMASEYDKIDGVYRLLPLLAQLSAAMCTEGYAMAFVHMTHYTFVYNSTMVRKRMENLIHVISELGAESTSTDDYVFSVSDEGRYKYTDLTDVDHRITCTSSPDLVISKRILVNVVNTPHLDAKDLLSTVCDVDVCGANRGIVINVYNGVATEVSLTGGRPAFGEFMAMAMGTKFRKTRLLTARAFTDEYSISGSDITAARADAQLWSGAIDEEEEEKAKAEESDDDQVPTSVAPRRKRKQRRTRKRRRNSEAVVGRACARLRSEGTQVAYPEGLVSSVLIDEDEFSLL